jgi:hypothetical protein
MAATTTRIIGKTAKALFYGRGTEKIGNRRVCNALNSKRLAI